MIANYFADLGAPVIDTDLIAREVVMPGSAALDEISAQFGPAVIADDGSLDRQAMRKLVFSSDDRRTALESILHPRIRDEAYRQAAREEGMLIGISSGATLQAIKQKLAETDGNPRILGFNYDTGERYLSVPDFLPED